MKFVDLSVPISEQTPVYPGDPITKLQPSGILEKDGYEDHYVCIGTHVGTHIDAPRHMIAGGKNLDEILVEQFIGPGVYVRVNKKFNLEEVQKVNIEEGEIVLFHTGMSDLLYESAYFEDYPEVTEDIANYLVGKKVKMVGMDMASPDHQQTNPIHKILLKNGILIIENLTNLSQLEGKEFKVYALPLKLQIDGAPARVIAEII